MPFKDPAKRKAYFKERTAKNIKELNKLKDVTCHDCGKTFPHYVLEFDHVPERGKKKFNLTRCAYVGTLKSPEFLEELAKCDVVCANCHKIRTYKRRATHSLFV